MPNFYFNEGQIILPDNWEDKTVSVLSFPANAEQSSASLTITRQRVSDKNINLATYVDQHLQTAKKFPSFKLLRHGDTVINGQEAEQLEFSWQTPEKIVVRQFQTILKHQNSIFITFTATSKKTNFDEFKEIFQSLFESIRFR
ncbi:protein containing DUF1795 [Candidatus Magnetomorum sp. HK-1]|nr:protein containing DUF1795 [Candidatus Magnetomorum sp. HK-1]